MKIAINTDILETIDYQIDYMNESAELGSFLLFIECK